MDFQTGATAQCELSNFLGFRKPQAAQEELHGRNERWRDAQFMHAQPHQQWDQGRFSGHFTAHPDRASVSVGCLHRHVYEAHHCRMSGLIQASHALVEPVDREGVTGEIVGADAEEIRFPR